MARLRDNVTATHPSNWAEWLWEVGKRVNGQIRRGAGIEEVSRALQTSTDTCKLAFVFFRARDLVKVRAMVEDWSRERLVAELGGAQRGSTEKQQAGTR